MAAVWTKDKMEAMQKSLDELSADDRRELFRNATGAELSADVDVRIERRKGEVGFIFITQTPAGSPEEAGGAVGGVKARRVRQLPPDDLGDDKGHVKA